MFDRETHTPADESVPAGPRQVCRRFLDCRLPAQKARSRLVRIPVLPSPSRRTTSPCTSPPSSSCWLSACLALWGRWRCACRRATPPSRRPSAWAAFSVRCSALHACGEGRERTHRPVQLGSRLQQAMHVPSRCFGLPACEPAFLPRCTPPTHLARPTILPPQGAAPCSPPPPSTWRCLRRRPSAPPACPPSGPRATRHGPTCSLWWRCSPCTPSTF